MDAEIKKTKDYSQFEFIVGNRRLSDNKIQRILKDIGDGLNLLPYCPIIVFEQNGKLLIVDGQHRFEISKRIEDYVYYVVCKELDIKQIATLNSRSEKWKPNDYLECFIGLGIYDYKRLKLFMKNYKMNIKVSTDLLMFNGVSGKSTEYFQTGAFKCKYYDEAAQLVEFSENIFDLYNFAKERYLLDAIQKIQKKGVIDWERFKTKLKAKPNNMCAQKDTRNYILNMERIYNDGVSNRTLLT